MFNIGERVQSTNTLRTGTVSEPPTGKDISDRMRYVRWDQGENSVILVDFLRVYEDEA